jgi:hypothetical protein
MNICWYLEHLDQVKTKRTQITQGKKWEYPPYCINGEYVSKEKFIEIETARRGPVGYRTTKIAYQETKKFPDLGRAKNRALFIVGYYNQFGTEMGMLNNRNPMMPWTKEWFIWSATSDGKIIQPVLNCSEYVEATQKFANLSKKYGTVAKDVFKKSASAETPSNAIIIFGSFESVVDRADLGNHPFYEETDYRNHQHDGQIIGEDYGYQFKPEITKDLKDRCKEYKIKKFGKTSAAVAMPTVEDAVMFKLLYDGKIEMRIIDMEKIEELVG